MTLDNDMPRTEAYRLYHLPDRFLVAVNALAPCEQIEHHYEKSLRGVPRRLVHWAFQVPDPRVDPEGYRAGAFWSPDTLPEWAWFDQMEAQGRLVPFDHVR